MTNSRTRQEFRYRVLVIQKNQSTDRKLLSSQEKKVRIANDK